MSKWEYSQIQQHNLRLHSFSIYINVTVREKKQQPKWLVRPWYNPADRWADFPVWDHGRQDRANEDTRTPTRSELHRILREARCKSQRIENGSSNCWTGYSHIIISFRLMRYKQVMGLFWIALRPVLQVFIYLKYLIQYLNTAARWAKW